MQREFWLFGGAFFAPSLKMFEMILKYFPVLQFFYNTMGIQMKEEYLTRF